MYVLLYIERERILDWKEIRNLSPRWLCGKGERRSPIKRPCAFVSNSASIKYKSPTYRSMSFLSCDHPKGWQICVDTLHIILRSPATVMIHESIDPGMCRWLDVIHPSLYLEYIIRSQSRSRVNYCIRHDKTTLNFFSRRGFEFVHYTSYEFGPVPVKMHFPSRSHLFRILLPNGGGSMNSAYLFCFSHLTSLIFVYITLLRTNVLVHRMTSPR